MNPENNSFDNNNSCDSTKNNISLRNFSILNITSAIDNKNKGEPINNIFSTAKSPTNPRKVNFFTEKDNLFNILTEKIEDYKSEKFDNISSFSAKTSKTPERTTMKKFNNLQNIFSDYKNETKKNQIKLTLNTSGVLNTNPNIKNIINNFSHNPGNLITSTNKIQFNIAEHEEIDYSQLNKIENNSFCDMFFLVGLPPEKIRTIPDSENFIAPCKHKNCSILSAYVPEILHFFPSISNDKIDLNSTVYKIKYFFLIKILIF